MHFPTFKVSRTSHLVCSQPIRSQVNGTGVMLPKALFNVSLEQRQRLYEGNSDDMCIQNRNLGTLPNKEKILDSMLTIFTFDSKFIPLGDDN